MGKDDNYQVQSFPAADNEPSTKTQKPVIKKNCWCVNCFLSFIQFSPMLSWSISNELFFKSCSIFKSKNSNKTCFEKGKIMNVKDNDPKIQ